MITHAPIKPPPRSALLNEALTPLQLGSLALQSPVLASAPRGRGERVIVLPGFGASDASTAVLRTYLNYLGYRVSGWGQGRNEGDVLALLARVSDHVLRLDEPVHLIGWSLGGYIAREVARDVQHAVDSVITLGSPVVGGPKYTAVASMFETADGALDDVERMVAERYAQPLNVPVTAIYSKLDGVVSWRACIDSWSPNVEHIEVLSTHAGLGFSANAFRIIARKLAGRRLTTAN